jgi:hypothetical protein
MGSKIYKFIFILMLVGVIWIIVRGIQLKSNIEEHGIVSVGKYVSYKDYPKTEANYFAFYIDGVKYRDDVGRLPIGFRENLGKFYKIIYSTKYKGNMKVFTDEQITDSLKILEAGFSKQQMKPYIKMY